MKRLLFIIILSLCLIACNNGISYHISFMGNGGFGINEEENSFVMCKCITSKEDLIELCDKCNNHFYDSSSPTYNNEIPTKVRTYDGTFFDTNDLIVIVTLKNDAFDYKVKGIDLIDSTLVVNLKKKYHYGTFTDEAYTYLILIEIRKCQHDDMILEIE